jgi:hypothetical protein
MASAAGEKLWLRQNRKMKRAKPIAVLQNAVANRQPDIVAAVAARVSVRTMSVFARALLPKACDMKAVTDRIYTVAMRSALVTIKDTKTREKVTAMLDRRRLAVVTGSRELDTAPWLCEAELVRVAISAMHRILRTRSNLSLPKMVAILSGDQCDQSERLNIIFECARGTNRLGKKAFERDLYAPRPEIRLIDYFKSEHQEKTFAVLFDQLPWMKATATPTLISEAARRPAWQCLFKLMLPRGFSLHTATWKRRPIVLAMSRRVKVIPPEANVHPDTDTLEWLARFATKSHVISAIRAGHRTTKLRAEHTDDMRALLRLARKPMRWSERTHHLFPDDARRAILAFMLCTRHLPRLPTEMLSMIFGCLKGPQIQ